MAEEELKQRFHRLTLALAPAEPDTPLNPNSEGMKGLSVAAQSGEAFADTLETPSGKFLGKAALSIAQNLAVLPTAVIHPAIPLVLMGAIATADKIHALSERGVPVSEALARGFVSGGIEAGKNPASYDTFPHQQGWQRLGQKYTSTGRGRDNGRRRRLLPKLSL